ncbi:MAG TPA: tail fiber domain-containing protein [Pyrinomonadaceae bacterium]|nr:tail fiber domain-containing protein [Pyrinomonadaceae bacterium]
MFNLTRFFRLSILITVLVLVANVARAQTSTFTYQGRLTDGAKPANGPYDFQFKLYDALTGGNQLPIGSPVTLNRSGVVATNGIFTVQLDFGASVFPGADRFLDIGVKRPTDSSYTSLNPRQQLASTPYSVQALSATNAVNATNATQLGGVAANQFVQTNDTRMSDARDPLPGSTNYIQNSTAPQSASNFDISGNGSAAGTLSGNVVNATTQYNIGGNRVLSASGNNLFAGQNAGTSNTTGSSNAFFGASAGTANQTGFNNSFFGYLAGNFNSSGGQNSFFGWQAGVFNTIALNGSFFGAGAGQNNTTGNSNSFFGAGAGFSNTTGANNSFFGQSAGAANTSASGNAFFGSSAGFHNTTGPNNSFFGSAAGNANTTGSDNSFFGSGAGDLNSTGTSNSFFGSSAGAANTTGFSNAFFGSAAGISNTTGTLNSFFGGNAGYSNTTGGANAFFGLQAGTSNTTGNVNSFFGYHAGYANTTGAANSFFGEQAGLQNTTASENAFFGFNAGVSNTTGPSNAFFGGNAGAFNTTAGNNSFFGASAGQNNTTGTYNTFFGRNSGLSNTTENANTFLGSNTNGAAGITNTTAVGANASVTQSNSLVLGSINGVNGATADTNAGIGTTAPNARLHIAVNGGNILLGDAGCAAGSTGIGFGSSLSGCTNYSLRGDGTDTNINRPTGGAIYFRENNTAQLIIEPGGVLAIATLGGGPGATLCRNNTTKEISNCSSSLRYKDHLASFTSGLDLINKLRPITFNWKQSGERDLGFAAEAVAAIEPLLVTYNDKGQIEGVKYERLSVAFVNAFKEQQTQIQRQQDQIKSQQNQIDALRKLICLDHPNADVCK